MHPAITAAIITVALIVIFLCSLNSTGKALKAMDDHAESEWPVLRGSIDEEV